MQETGPPPGHVSAGGGEGGHALALPSSCCTVWVSIWCHHLCGPALYNPGADGLWPCQHSAVLLLLFPLIPIALMAQTAGQASLRPLFRPGIQKSREALLLWA